MAACAEGAPPKTDVLHMSRCLCIVLCVHDTILNNAPIEVDDADGAIHAINRPQDSTIV
jgi:hypothetical protein